MNTSKARKNELIRYADEVIRNSNIYENDIIISDSFNGQIAAFSVSIALSGLKPTLAVYYNSDASNTKIDRKKIIALLMAMCAKDSSHKGLFSDKGLSMVKNFYNEIIQSEGEKEKVIHRIIIEYAIALKLAIRTFKFKNS